MRAGGGAGRARAHAVRRPAGGSVQAHAARLQAAAGGASRCTARPRLRGTCPRCWRARADATHPPRAPPCLAPASSRSAGVRALSRMCVHTGTRSDEGGGRARGLLCAARTNDARRRTSRAAASPGASRPPGPAGSHGSAEGLPAAAANQSHPRAQPTPQLTTHRVSSSWRPRGRAAGSTRASTRRPTPPRARPSPRAALDPAPPPPPSSRAYASVAAE